MVFQSLFHAVVLFCLVSNSSGGATLQIEGSDQRRTVLESVGTTEICISLRNATPGDFILFSIKTSSSEHDSDLYFEDLDVIRFFNAYVTRTCADVRIVHNGIETGNRKIVLLVRLFYRMSTGTVTPDSANKAMDLIIEIQDTDEVEVGFNRAGYQVTEGDSVRICVDLNSGQILPGVDVELVHAFSPAVANGLQTGLMKFILSNSSRLSCIDFATGSADTFIDSNRVQTATLMSGDITVQFSRNSSTVEIIDASVATLAIVNMTSLEVVEGGFNTTTVVTICLDLISVEGGLRRDIVVNIIGNGTATVSNNDYSIPITTLIIPSGTTIVSFMSSDYCVNVTIIGDDVRELNETILLTFDASPDVFQGPDNVAITILDNGDIVTCEQPSLPFGTVMYLAGTSYLIEGVMTSYSCRPGYRLEGSPVRTCLSDGTWSGTAPICIPVTCPMLGSPANGEVVHSGMLVGSFATYSCSRGFMLEGIGAGGARRMCSLNGTWTGSEPTCTPLEIPSSVTDGAIRTNSTGVILFLVIVSVFDIVIHSYVLMMQLYQFMNFLTCN